MKKHKVLVNILLSIFIASILTFFSSTNASAKESINTQYYGYDSSQDITVYYSGASGKDWIGIYKEGTTPSSSQPALAWKYTSGSSGSVTFNPSDFINSQYSPEKGSPLESGKYKAIFLKNDGYNVVASYNFEISGGEPLYSFEVLSDMHVVNSSSNELNNHVISALNDIKKFAPNNSCIVANGDSVDQWDWDTYSKLRTILNDNKIGLPYIYFNLGNHEFIESSHDSSQKSVSYSDLLNRYLYFSKNIHYNMKNDTSTNISHTEQTGPYYEETVNNNHFIFLGNESLESRDKAYISNTQLEWLDNKLWNIAKYGGDQPVFVFLHQSLANTVAGSYDYQGWSGVIQDSQLRFILNKYPNVFFFTGHSHWTLTSANSMYQDKSTYGSTLGATMFTSASASDLWSDAKETISGSQGLHVNVYRDKVIVKGRDYLNRQWIPSARFSIDLNAKYNALHLQKY